jgi:uncharacterized phage-like protein YoqJ
MTTLAITGHRPEKLGGYKPNPLGLAVQRALREEIELLRPTKLISGMALGVDQWAAWIAVRLGVPFIAAVPFEGQELVWKDAEKRRRYHKLLALAVHVHVNDTETPASRTAAEVADAMFWRNRWMVDHCDILLAVWDGSRSGTGNCVRYAQQVGRRIVRIDPKTRLAMEVV